MRKLFHVEMGYTLICQRTSPLTIKLNPLIITCYKPGNNKSQALIRRTALIEVANKHCDS